MADTSGNRSILAQAAYGLFPGAAVALAAVMMTYGTSVPGVPAGLLYAVVAVVLFGTVFAAVHHAEVIALRVGEPFGTLIVTLSVTVIEVSLIVSMMLGGHGNAVLARDTVFSVIMIVCNGLIGLCLLLGGLRYREQSISQQGAAAYLSVLTVLAGITLILPNYTATVPGPVYSASQLMFVSIVTTALYCVFLFIQTRLHREYFIDDAAAAEHHGRPGGREVVFSALGLLLGLLGVILLAKKMTVVVATGLATAGIAPGVSGVILAVLVLLPESGIALKAARHNDLARSINAALGSSLATIGLTIPAVAVVSLILNQPLILGLEPKDIVLLALTFGLSYASFGTGKTNILTGLVHLVVFAVFLFLMVVP